MEKRLMIIILQKIYINKIGKRITLKIKTGYYLELLTLETMRLPKSTKMVKMYLI